jgi:hypothetical protein
MHYSHVDIFSKSPRMAHSDCLWERRKGTSRKAKVAATAGVAAPRSGAGILARGFNPGKDRAKND